MLSALFRAHVTAFLLLATLILCGCGNSAAGFNNKLAAIEKKLQPAVETFQKNLRAGAFATIDADYANMVAALDTATKEAQAVTVINAPQAKEFHAAYLAYYASIKSAVTDMIKPRLDILRNPPAGDSTSPSVRLAMLDTDFELALREATFKLRQSQQNFAGANNMKIEKPRK